MKKLLIFFGILLLFPLASAFYEGQTFTQSQIDGYDILTLTKQDIDLHATSYRVLSRYSVLVYYDYLEIYPQPDNTYIANYSHNYIILNAVEMGQMCYNQNNAVTLNCIKNVYIEGKTDLFLNYVRYDVNYYKTGIKNALLAWLDSLVGG